MPMQPVELNASRAARLFARALTRRCPACGERGLFVSWMKMAPRCPHCGIRPERGEREDYWLGAYMFNLVIAELLFVAAFIAAVLITWPTPPWTILEYGSVAMTILTPIALYPISKNVWLAFDLMLRPATREELEGERPA